jgi:hypothetical protein
MMKWQVVNTMYLLSVIGFIVLSVAAAVPAAYAAPETGEVVGKVITIVGEAKATTTDNKERTLNRGSTIYEGDIIFTDENSQVQLRFTDGTILSLRKSSRYYIEEYEYQDDITPGKKFFARLVEGGFRTVTGAIGDEDRSEYRVLTPVSMIGIRGTDYSAVLENMMLYVAVWKGKVILTNDKGSILIGDGEKHRFAIITGKDVLGRGLDTVPSPIRTCQFEETFHKESVTPFKEELDKQEEEDKKKPFE